MANGEFRFGFSDPDIENDGEDGTLSEGAHRITNNSNADTHKDRRLGIRAESHCLEELIWSEGQHIAFNTLEIPVANGEMVRIPRRELWDVRMQVMREDNENPHRTANSISQRRNQNVVSDDTDLRRIQTDSIGVYQSNTDTFLGPEDVRDGVYEGGLKSWECASDLVGVLASHTIEKGTHIIELGCGTALPGIYLFQKALQTNIGYVHFTFADYNVDVLRLVTIPNLYLSWLMITNQNGTTIDGQEVSIEQRPLEFLEDLGRRKIHIDFISGPWGDSFVNIVKNLAQRKKRLVLASETIYSPASLPAFTKTLMSLLREASTSQALLAAKRMYFGVGGGVEEFHSELMQQLGTSREVAEERCQGVSRVVLEITALRV
ncbi:MAG: hypothetical protein M1825_002302 [Sarcosagium campestre]|nr:MAG: hypothetical protein M1825_002302 [Sarcosagium campestre]